MAAYVDMGDAQFENVNALRKFPFACDASLLDREGRELPADAIVDVRLFVPATFGNATAVPSSLPSARLSSLHISRAMVSACFVSEQGGAVSAMSATVAASRFRPYMPVRLEKLHGTSDAGGIVTFGDVFAWLDADDPSGTPKTYFFDDARIHPCQVVRAMPAALRRIVDPRSGESVAGDVSIEFSGYVNARRDGSSVELSLVEGADVELSSECARATGAQICGTTPITSINGIRPDEDGDIVLWFH